MHLLGVPFSLCHRCVSGKRQHTLHSNSPKIEQRNSDSVAFGGRHLRHRPSSSFWCPFQMVETEQFIPLFEAFFRRTFNISRFELFVVFFVFFLLMFFFRRVAFLSSFVRCWFFRVCLSSKIKITDESSPVPRKWHTNDRINYQITSKYDWRSNARLHDEKVFRSVIFCVCCFTGAPQISSAPRPDSFQVSFPHCVHSSFLRIHRKSNKIKWPKMKLSADNLRCCIRSV